jgi:hypothetical protein
MELAPVVVSMQRAPRAQVPRLSSHDAFVTLLPSAPEKPAVPTQAVPVVSKENPVLQPHIADPASEDEESE